MLLVLTLEYSKKKNIKYKTSSLRYAIQYLTMSHRGQLLDTSQ